jgi:hypothetical protein
MAYARSPMNIMVIEPRSIQKLVGHTCAVNVRFTTSSSTAMSRRGYRPSTTDAYAGRPVTSRAGQVSSSAAVRPLARQTMRPSNTACRCRLLRARNRMIRNAQSST